MTYCICKLYEILHQKCFLHCWLWNINHTLVWPWVYSKQYIQLNWKWYPTQEATWNTQGMRISPPLTMIGIHPSNMVIGIPPLHMLSEKCTCYNICYHTCTCVVNLYLRSLWIYIPAPTHMYTANLLISHVLQ